MDFVVAAIIYDEEGRVLLLDHVKTGLWTIPLGASKPQESPEDCLCRELREELGIEVVMGSNCRYATLNCPGDGYIHTFVFEIRYYTGHVKNLEPNKHRSLKYVEICDIPEKITEATRFAFHK